MTATTSKSFSQRPLWTMSNIAPSDSLMWTATQPASASSIVSAAIRNNLLTTDPPTRSLPLGIPWALPILLLYRARGLGLQTRLVQHDSDAALLGHELQSAVYRVVISPARAYDENRAVGYRSQALRLRELAYRGGVDYDKLEPLLQLLQKRLCSGRGE